MIADLAARMKPADVAEKYGLTKGNVYAIRQAARKAGVINSRGEKSISERVRDESSVFTPALRERIKDLREQELTSTEIATLLQKEGISASIEQVRMVMARGASDLLDGPLGKRWGITH